MDYQPSSVTITLEPDEALALYNAIAKLDDADLDFMPDRAAHWVMNRIQGQLERTLAEPFMSDYGERVEHARRRILISAEGDDASKFM
ncbi:MAG: hypothetical protein AAF432_16710 [Planctomycetota bacterium]